MHIIVLDIIGRQDKLDPIETQGENVHKRW